MAWTAIDADSKLIVSWYVGDKSYELREEFMQAVASRLANRVQLTTDGNKAYLQAVDDAFATINFDAIDKDMRSSRRLRKL